MENDILSFLKGNDSLIREKILNKINYHSENMNYELALELKNELDYMEDILSKQKVELNDLKDRDIINFYMKNGYVSLNIFFVR